MVGVNISLSYFHPGGADITQVKIISHTGMAESYFAKQACHNKQQQKLFKTPFLLLLF